MIPEERRQLVIEKFLEGVERKKIAAYYSMPYSTVNHIIAEYMKGKTYPVFHKKCDKCGKEFETFNAKKRWCSGSCAQFAWRKAQPKKTEIKTCPTCTKEFQVTNEHKKYCSSECKEAKKLKIETREDKVKKTHKSISEMAAEARALGMSYGEYVRYIEG